MLGELFVRQLSNGFHYMLIGHKHYTICGMWYDEVMSQVLIIDYITEHYFNLKYCFLKY